MAVPHGVVSLVRKFEENRAAYQSGAFNETSTRVQFINPLFRELGWDVDNASGAPEAYKDVVHEDAVKVGAYTKAPDYSFRVGGARRFFLEAKKPSVNLHDDVNPAFQLRRYAWSAKLPVSLLTDFEEMAVYDCRREPIKTDAAHVARERYYRFDEYAEKWDEIAGLFSKDAVLAGSLDKYAEAAAGRGSKSLVTVDAAFLREMNGWRELLAHDLAARNPHLSARELNFAVQMTIDRVVFLRICEDRGTEPPGKLQGVQNGPNVYARLCHLFREADERYNSGLFHFSPEAGRTDGPDALTLTLNVGDETLRTILSRLYPPDSPYAFAVIPIEILGQVYEQFLGKVIRVEAGTAAQNADRRRTVVIEEKPEVRKAGGVYYTPTYIVEYIVRETVGKLVAGKTPKQVAALHICDPACGSGSFLIGAYQFLLDWHRDWYLDETNGGAKKHKKELYQGPGGEWRLTTEVRKRVLLNNIFGVDIDTQAVEVTKLSLLLCVLSGETAETVHSSLALFHQRALPSLENNVKCGNSLIGPDFYDKQQMALFDEDALYRINVFDWKAAFPAVFKGDAPGFDAVIGNPPYIRIQSLKEWNPVEVEFYKKAYRAAAKGNYDIYVVFVEKGLSLLNGAGRLGYILPHKFFNAEYGQPTRELVSSGRHLSKVVHFGDQQVFANATTYTTLLFLEKAGSEYCRVVKANDLMRWRIREEGVTGDVPAAGIGGTPWNFTVGSGAGLFDKLRQMPVKLGDIATLFVGLQTSADTVFLFKDSQKASANPLYSKELDRAVEVEPDLLKPVVRSGNIGRYWAQPTARVLFPYQAVNGKSKLIPEAVMSQDYPKAWSYLEANKELLSGREHDKFLPTGWYQIYPKNLDVWEQPKILLPYMTTRLAAYYDEANLYFVNVTTGGFGLTVDGSQGSMKYLTALLNSSLLDWFFKSVTTNFNSGYFAANKQFLVQLPIRAIDFDDASDKARHDKMVALVEKMLDLHKRHKAARTPQETSLLAGQIAAADRQIDALVYELYGLTSDEIALVEAATNAPK